MDPSAPSRPEEPPTTDNPIAAVGRKVKSVLGTSQRPSVRIVRQPSSIERPRQQEETYSAPPEQEKSTNRFAGARKSIGSLFGHGDDTNNETSVTSARDEYDPDTVDLLDVVDPEVSALNTLTNVQNSLFVPNLGKVVNRRATYRLSENPEEARIVDRLKSKLERISTKIQEKSKLARSKVVEPEFQYAVFPDDEKLEGWSKEEKEQLDDLVRHYLHSRRAKFKRSMKGFWQYVRRPLGLFITVYATLITLFGAAWVLFLIGWISIGSRKDYIINVVDNVLVGLFAVIGDGLAPFRAVDTYHMLYIIHYHRKTWKIRQKLGLPDLVDHNDLPNQRKEEVEHGVDIESLVARKMPKRWASKIAPKIPKRISQRIVNRYKDVDWEYSVLTEEQQAKLDHHERKFSKSHTFYKPHETETHYAFPVKLLVAIVLLLDCHSMLQISLGACTWGISYKTRPFALTTVILCCSITCNIMGGVLISMGDKRTRKKDVIERMYMEELTMDAKDELEKRWMKEAEERGQLDPAVRKRIEEEKEEEENEELKKAWKGVPSLPKKLLGKGEDHRQPSLPQSAKRSSKQSGSRTPTTTSSSSSSSSSSKMKSKFSKTSTEPSLPPVQETPAQPSRPPKAVLGRGEPPNESTGHKVMRLIRRADMDKS